MDRPRAPALFDLLARAWRRPAAVTAVAFDERGTAAAFASADGSVAIAPLADPEPAASRIRIGAEDGRMTIRPRDRAAPPLVELASVADGAPLVVPFGRRGFAVGGTEGAVLAVSPAGEAVPLRLRMRQPVTCLARDARHGRLAAVAGGEVAILADPGDGDATWLDHPTPVAAVAFSPDGQRIACAQDGSVVLHDLAGAPARVLDVPGRPVDLSFSPDGAWLACPLADEGFHLVAVPDGRAGPVRGYPTPVRSIAWSTAASTIVTSGAFRIAAWSMDRPPIHDAVEGALETGRPGLVVVERVAAHPTRDLVAAGYANGHVVVARIGHRDELLVRTVSGAAVTALAWSADGGVLALGTSDGTAALIGFPPQLFKA